MLPAPSRPTCPQPSPTNTILRRDGGEPGVGPARLRSGSAAPSPDRRARAPHRTAPPPPASPPLPRGRGCPVYTAPPPPPLPASCSRGGRRSPPRRARPRRWASRSGVLRVSARGPPLRRGVRTCCGRPRFSPHHHAPGPVSCALGLGEKFPQVAEVPRRGSGRGAAGQPHRAAGGAGAAEVPRPLGPRRLLTEYYFLSCNRPNFSGHRIRRSQPCEARSRAHLAARPYLAPFGRLRGAGAARRAPSVAGHGAFRGAASREGSRSAAAWPWACGMRPPPAAMAAVRQPREVARRAPRMMCPEPSWNGQRRAALLYRGASEQSPRLGSQGEENKQTKKPQN